MRRLPPIPLLALLLAAALPVLARADARSPRAPIAPAGPVAVGQWVTTPVPALPAGAREFELLLVPDGGPAVRVSAEQDAGAGAIRWRVPAVAARHARLVLRVGDERSERDSPPSDGFDVGALPADESAQLRRGRSDAGFRVLEADGPATAVGPGRERLAPGAATPVAAAGPHTPSLVPPRRRSEAIAAAPTVADAGAIRPAQRSVARITPLRI